jgi:hypothetical protein
MSATGRPAVPKRNPLTLPSRTNYLTPKQANRRRIRAAIIGLALVFVGFPFIYEWAGSAPSPATLDLVLGGAFVACGGACLSAAGLNRLGRNWWSDATQEDEPIGPI